MTRRPQRPGTSLLEVLVGLGIMAVGAISAFVLFPLSTINVGRALLDDRTTTCAVTADGQLRDIHRQTAALEMATANSGELYFRALDNPGAVGVAGAPVLTALDADRPSYPVIIDPMGYGARNPPSRTAIGDGGETLIPRVNLNLLNGDNRLALRFCSQMDGLSYSEDGVANAANPSELRELRYNWLWVVQRPVNRDRYNLRMQIVVFDKRAHLYAPPGSEAVATANFTAGTTTIDNVPQTAEVRKGSWVMDATMGTDGAGRPLRHAEFYRVVSVTDTGTSYTLEVHKPITRPDGLGTLTAPVAHTGNLVVMPGVAEVFERPMLTAAPAP